MANTWPSLTTQYMIAKSVQKDRSSRYQQAVEIRPDLQQLKQASNPHVQPGAAERQPATGVRGRLSWISMPAIVLVLALIAGYFGWRCPPTLTGVNPCWTLRHHPRRAFFQLYASGRSTLTCCVVVSAAPRGLQQLRSMEVNVVNLFYPGSWYCLQ